MSDQFTQFLQGALARQEESNDSFNQTLDSLNVNVRENSLLLGRVIEKLNA